MNDEQVRIFLTVADQGSFTRAEEKIFLSKQSMLKQMNHLEEEIGCPLFNRSRSGVKLTPAGEIFYDGIRKLKRQKDKLMEHCRSAAGLDQSIRVGSVEHQVILDRVNTEFALRYPNVRIERVIHPNHSGEWRVENGIQDVGETFRSEYHNDKNFTYIPLTLVPYQAAMRKGHPLAGRSSLKLSQLTGYPTILFAPMVGKERMQSARQAFSLHPEHLIQRMDVDNQVSAAYECMESNSILITANPFIGSLEGLIKIPLDEGWMREYGIIYKEPASWVVRQYVDLAIELY